MNRLYDAVAIPSSNRVAKLTETTLPLLLDGGVPAHMITVFVPDAGQAAEYVAAVGGLGVQVQYGHGIGMREARNAIARAYATGTRLVQIDDDIKGIFRHAGPKTLDPVVDVDALFSECAAEAGGSLWCVYPVPNPFFMHADRVRRGLWYAEGCLFGYTVRNDETELVTVDDKEDFERSIRFYLRDGEVVRFDSITFRTRFYKEPGGMQDYRTEDTIRQGAQSLEALYPGLAKARLAKSGRWEVRLRDVRGKA